MEWVADLGMIFRVNSGAAVLLEACLAAISAQALVDPPRCAGAQRRLRLYREGKPYRVP